MKYLRNFIHYIYNVLFYIIQDSIQTMQINSLFTIFYNNFCSKLHSVLDKFTMNMKKGTLKESLYFMYLVNIEPLF